MRGMCNWPWPPTTTCHFFTVLMHCNSPAPENKPATKPVLGHQATSTCMALHHLPGLSTSRRALPYMPWHTVVADVCAHVSIPLPSTTACATPQFSTKVLKLCTPLGVGILPCSHLHQVARVCRKHRVIESGPIFLQHTVSRPPYPPCSVPRLVTTHFNDLGYPLGHGCKEL